MVNLVKIAKLRKATSEKIPSDHEDMVTRDAGAERVLIILGRFPINKTQKLRFLTFFSVFVKISLSTILKFLIGGPEKIKQTEFRPNFM